MRVARRGDRAPLLRDPDSLGKTALLPHLPLPRLCAPAPRPGPKVRREAPAKAPARARLAALCSALGRWPRRELRRASRRVLRAARALTSERARSAKRRRPRFRVLYLRRVMLFPYPLSTPLLLLLLLVAGAAASTPAVNGTCPADSPKVCEENCCNRKERCALKRRPTKTSTRYCEPHSLVIAACICAVAAAIFVAYTCRRQRRETTQATPADSEAPGVAEKFSPGARQLATSARRAGRSTPWEARLESRGGAAEGRQLGAKDDERLSSRTTRALCIASPARLALFQSGTRDEITAFVPRQNILHARAHSRRPARRR